VQKIEAENYWLEELHTRGLYGDCTYVMNAPAHALADQDDDEVIASLRRVRDSGRAGSSMGEKKNFTF